MSLLRARHPHAVSGLLALLVLLFGSGCGERRPQPGTRLAEPCPGSGVSVELGSPFEGQEFAAFDVSGGTVYVTVRQYEKGGIFDSEPGRSKISIGPVDRPPVLDESSRRISNVVAEATVIEDTWSAVALPAGRYWLWTSRGSDVALRSCGQDGVTNADRV